MSTATLNRADLAFRVEAGPFADAMTWVAKRIPSRPTIPTLGGVLIEVADGELTLSTFDYDVSNRATLGITGDDTHGRVLVSGRLLAGLVATFPAKPVDVALDGSRLAVTCGTIRTSLPCMVIEDYPALPTAPPTVGTVDGAALSDVIERVAVAADRNGSTSLKPLAGIHLQFGADAIRVMGTDSYRFAMEHLGWKPADAVDAEALVPCGVLVEAAKTFHAGSEVTIAVDEGLISLSAPGRELTARLLAEKFPVQFAKVCPAPSPNAARVQVVDLVAALRRANLVRDEKAPARLDFADDGVTVSAAGQLNGSETGEVVECEYAGEPIGMHVNPQFLIEALSALGSPTADLSMTEPKKPILLTAPDADDAAYRHLMMPIRLPGGNA